MNSGQFDNPIAINGQELATTETEGRRFFILPLSGNAILGFQKTILMNGLCPNLLPMRFIAEGDIINAYYRWDRLVQLKVLYKRWKHEDVNIALGTIEMVSSIIQCALSIENYLFMTDGYQLNADIIFVHPKTREVKLAFVPTGKQRQTGLVERLMDVMEDTMQFTDDEQWLTYGKEILESIVSSEDSLISIEKKLHKKARTIYEAGWPRKSELRGYTP